MNKNKEIKVNIVKRETPIESKKIDDPFISYFGVDKVYTPKYDALILETFVEESNILPQCIRAYKNNVITTWRLRLADGLAEKEKENPEALEEKKSIELLFDYSAENNLIKNLQKALEDRERTGTGYLEVIRNPLNEVVGFSHIPPVTMRFLKPTAVIHTRVVRTPYGPKHITQKRRFFKFAQINSLNQKVYFKDFGDPRDLHYETGEYGKYPYDKKATEIIAFKIDAPGTPYGIPRYMGNLLSVLGSRKSELINYYYFENGRHIPMAVIVEGGVLSEEGMNNLKEYLNESKGVDNSHKILLLEAAPEEDEAVISDEKKKQVKVRFEPLAHLMQQDALFVEYDEQNRKKIRSSFQLPPIYTGETDDYTRATALESERVTEKSVFRPLRREIEEGIDYILEEMNIKHWWFEFEDNDVKDRTEISGSLQPFVSQMTVNQIQSVLNIMVPEIKTERYEEEWANLPIAMLGFNTGLEKKDKADDLKDTLTDILRGLRQNEHGSHG